MNLFVKFAAGFAGLYVLVVALIALAQDWLIFPRWAMGHGAAAPPSSAERLALKAPSGEQLVGVYLPTEVQPSAESALILGFGGNAWNADTLAVYLQSVFPDRDVVTFHLPWLCSQHRATQRGGDPSGCAFDPRSRGRRLFA